MSLSRWRDDAEGGGARFVVPDSSHDRLDAQARAATSWHRSPASFWRRAERCRPRRPLRAWCRGRSVAGLDLTSRCHGHHVRHRVGVGTAEHCGDGRGHRRSHGHHRRRRPCDHDPFPGRQGPLRPPCRQPGAADTWSGVERDRSARGGRVGAPVVAAGGSTAASRPRQSWGVEVDGHVLTTLVRGMASVVIDANGSAHVGVWGETVPAPREAVASVRQNLPPLVFDSAPKSLDRGGRRVGEPAARCGLPGSQRARSGSRRQSRLPRRASARSPSTWPRRSCWRERPLPWSWTSIRSGCKPTWPPRPGGRSWRPSRVRTNRRTVTCSGGPVISSL